MVVTVVRLASAVADGPDVVGVDGDPPGAEGLGSDAAAPIGTVAVVPGPVAVVELLAGPFAAVVVMLDAAMGSLVATSAGPALPPSADAVPPTVEPSTSGRTIGSAEIAGPSARARLPHTLRSAMIAVSSSSFLIS